MGHDSKFETSRSSLTPTIQSGISVRQCALCSKRLINKRTLRTQPIHQPEPVCKLNCWLEVVAGSAVRVKKGSLVLVSDVSDARHKYTPNINVPTYTKTTLLDC